MPDEPWPEGAGQHCQCWYENDPCCWCGDPPAEIDSRGELVGQQAETPCPANPNGERG